MKRSVFALLTLPTLLLTGCDNLNRSLLFYTQTNVGIEVGVDPAQQSGKVLVGYKRAEGVVNPVYLPPEKLGTKTVTTNTSTPNTPGPGATGTSSTQIVSTGPGVTIKDVYREHAYSVIAKLKGKGSGKSTVSQTGEAVVSGEIAQWFATGRAAEILARNDLAAAALTGNPSIGSGKLSNNISNLDPLNFASQLQHIYDGLTAWSAAGDPIASGHIYDLDQLASIYFSTLVRLKIYRQTTAGVSGSSISGNSFSVLTSVPSNAENTIKLINKLISTPPHGGFTVVQLQSDLKLAQFHLKESEERLNSSPIVIAAVKYYAEKLLGK